MHYRPGRLESPRDIPIKRTGLLSFGLGWRNKASFYLLKYICWPLFVHVLYLNLAAFWHNIFMVSSSSCFMLDVLHVGQSFKCKKVHYFDRENQVTIWHLQKTNLRTTDLIQAIRMLILMASMNRGKEKVITENYLIEFMRWLGSRRRPAEQLPCSCFLVSGL